MGRAALAGLLKFALNKDYFSDVFDRFTLRTRVSIIIYRRTDEHGYCRADDLSDRRGESGLDRSVEIHSQLRLFSQGIHAVSFNREYIEIVIYRPLDCFNAYIIKRISDRS